MQYVNLITGRVFGGRQTGEHFKEIDDITAKELYILGKEGSKPLDDLARQMCRGKIVNILGNGPSLKGFKPDGNPVIGVNGCSAHCKPDLLVVVDNIHDDRPLNQFIRSELRNLDSIMSLTTYVNLIIHHPEFVAKWKPLAIFDSKNTLSISKLANGLFLRKSSVHACVHFALMGGATEIRLFGVDYNDRSHWYNNKIHKDPKDQKYVPWVDYDQHLMGWRMLVQLANARKQVILNANASSRLVIEKIMPLFDCGISIESNEEAITQADECEDIPIVIKANTIENVSNKQAKEPIKPKYDEFIESITQGLKPQKIEV